MVKWHLVRYLTWLAAVGREFVIVYLIYSSAMAPVIAKMLQKNEGKHCNAGVKLTRQGSFREERTPDEEKIDLKRKFLSDLVLLLNHNKINRR